MSFLFKSSKKGAGPPTTASPGPPNALPPATRDIRSSDGQQQPPLNPIGLYNNGIQTSGLTKPASPTPVSPMNNIVSTALNQPEDKALALQEHGRGSGPPSPEQKAIRTQDGASRIPPQVRPPPTDSPYPWSQRRLNFTVAHTPFPRYGAAVNATVSKDGSIYLMGGLINGNAIGDLWMIETAANSMTCYPVATTSQGPGQRVGHASLLVGNAFIVFGGDNKVDEGDMLDDTLYLLNTSTKQWSRAQTVGPRPPGRYGHTLNILGSKIYIFGGQVESYFFNDLVAFDLNALQQASNRWDVRIQNTIDGGPPHGQIPPARTNHTMVSWNDRLYLFGGTDGVNWFNDVWSYNPHTNSWTQLECIGYIPSPREGHAAALVGDVMYIFGGRTEEGTDLGDLAAFRISSRRWYTFQNMGPSPSPRSGHSMTTVGKQIVVLAGEPSSAPRDPVELALAYFLDTSKIRYPADSGATPADRIQGHTRPSGEIASRSTTPGAANNIARGQPRESTDSTDQRARADSALRLSRAAPQGAPPPAPLNSPPLQQPPPPQQQPRVNGAPTARQPSRPFSPANDTERAQRFEERAAGSPQTQNARASPALLQTRIPGSPALGDDRAEDAAKPKPETYRPTQEQSEGPQSRAASRGQNLGETDDKVQGGDDGVRPQESGLGSSPALNQHFDGLAKELEQVKQRNAWYASELALARKSGFQSRSVESPAFDERTTDIFGEDEKPLVEALLKMRAELTRIQGTIDAQSRSTAERISDMEKQRDAAINEAVSAKARLAGVGSPASAVDSSETARGAPSDGTGDVHKRLATSLSSQADLKRQIDALKQHIETERYARELAEGTADAAQKRLAELDSSRQEYTSELESLRAELHEAQKEAREALANHTEISAQHKLLLVDKQELHGKLERSLVDTQSHGSVLTGLRDAVASSTDKSRLLEQQLEEERKERNVIQEKLASLLTLHESSKGELELAQRRVRDAEELAGKHAKEAESHRSAVLAGLSKITDHDYDAHDVADERVTILQQQVLAANALMRQNQAAANASSEKLRRAEERIAGLEAYQEQTSREMLSARKQFQQSMKEIQSLGAEKTDLEARLQTQLLETNALSVQHVALKDILSERGINASDVRRSRAVDSPNGSSRFSTPDLQRMRELEQQLDASLKSHEEMRTQFEEVSERDGKMKREMEEKLTVLDNDHQAAVKYLRGTEKMLSKMKQELQRVKNENGEMKKKLEKGGSSEDTQRGAEVPAEWETEKDKMRKDLEEAQTSLKTSVAAMEGRLASMQGQLQTAQAELELSRSKHATTQSDLTTLQTQLTQHRTDMDRLQKDNGLLEERAKDAEAKVHLLLDQVESSVDNYRRQSRMSMGGPPLVNGTNHARNLASAAGPESTAGQTHARNDSEGGASTLSGGEGTDVRNSMALDSLASELDALRSHWETTNRNYRLSDRFDFERSPAAPNAGNTEFSSLANWRSNLDFDSHDDDAVTPTSATHAGTGGTTTTTMTQPAHGGAK